MNFIEYEVGTQPIRATFQTSYAKHYFPIVTLSINDNINFLENLEQRFRRRMTWTKYGSEIT